MRNWLEKLFSENSEVSCGRVMSMISLFIGAAVAIIGLLKDRDLNALAMLAGVFISGSVIGKIGQKYVENKATKKPEDLKE